LAIIVTTSQVHLLTREPMPSILLAAHECRCIQQNSLSNS